MSYSVPSELYREVALRLSEAIGSGGYFSGTLAFAWGEAECRLTASVIVYRQRISAPDGQADVISRLALELILSQNLIKPQTTDNQVQITT